MRDLAILIPSRNEIFLARTIEDILTNMRGDTEIIAVLDGQWADPPVSDNERVTLVYHPISVGQRAATNEAARISNAKYVMKVDAHCAFDEGFDVKMMEDMQPDWTFVPVMRNLHAFDWVCPNGHRRYQGPSGNCAECGEPTVRDVVWIAKKSPQSTAYCFDNTLHFQYDGEYKKKQVGDLVETMSIQGSCFMVTKDKFFELNLCDEEAGSWGQQGVEVACKTWLSGGRVMVNRKTWYAHMFRTQGADFSFPYPNPGISKAREYSRRLWFGNTYDKQIYPLSWLLEKFYPVPGWPEEDLEKVRESGKSFSPPSLVASSNSPTKGIVYFTDNELDPKIMTLCQRQLDLCLYHLQPSISVNHPPIDVVSVSLKPLNFVGTRNIVLPLERGYLTMFKQILAGLEALDTDIVFFAEHDVLYHPSHFTFTPIDKTKIYYNVNVWKLRYPDGHALHYDCRQTSGLCAYRGVLLEHYKNRVKRTEAKLSELGDTYQYRQFIRRQGFEPGTHNRAERVDDLQSEEWQSTIPNIDIRHDKNLTPNRWTIDQFRRKPNEWIESDSIPGWGLGREIIHA